MEAIVSLITLALLEIVLGIDNIIFVSIAMGGLKKKEQEKARKVWMVSGICIRALLLLLLSWLVSNPMKFQFGQYEFQLGNLVMLAGGIFLLVKTVMELHHKLEGNEKEEEKEERKRVGSQFTTAVFQIILIDTVFSFDSMFTAIGLSRQLPVMICAIVVAMIIMFLFSGKISKVLQQHPTLTILGLSFLLMVGFTLFFEGLEPIHHQHVPKGYIYFSMAFSFGVELFNMRMRKKNKPVKLNEPESN
jgi:predicted tellurium resistance membrane protein TerC